jgi:DNA modification methylase
VTISILKGDCREVLRTLPGESVHCVVTSPPYWGLRDYGVVGQLGLEPTYQEYVANMVEIFREIRRVLRKDGTCWVNMGDSYAANVNGRSAADVKALGNDDRTFRDKPFSTIHGVLKPKDLCGIPWRLAFALQADGWWLRQDIIWSKPNPMPESVTDRCTKAHEYLFLLSKNERYYYDADAIREKSTSEFGEGIVAASQKYGDEIDIARSHSGWMGGNGITRNKRSVWEIATQPFPEAHFATFPPALIEPCIKAGCPKDGTVLDPFGGAGTTGLIADRLGRNAILIELNPEYIAMAERRLRDDAGMFAEVVGQ